METRPHIAVVTGNRADYGLLRGVIQELDSRVRCSLYVTGTHWLPRFGSTWREIERDGFSFEAIDTALGSDRSTATAKSVSLGLSGFADVWDRVRPDWVLVLGDRFEIFAAAQAAFFLGIPVAHIGGGDVTEGAFDDSIRHAISKLASLHFVATKVHADRLIAMGESLASVFWVGSLGVENAEREISVGPRSGGREILVTIHPETNRAQSKWTPILDHLERVFKKHPQFKYVLTAPNGDPGSEAILRWGEKLKRVLPGLEYVENFGQAEFFRRVLDAQAVVGNSSSGIFEIPALGIPFLHVGRRQCGREFPQAVVPCDAASEAEVEEAFRRVVSPEFSLIAARRETPYRGEAPARQIAEILATYPLPLGKHFRDGGGNAI